MGTPISSYPDYIQRQLREQIEADKARRAAQCQTCKGALTIKVNGKLVRCFECRGKNDTGKVIPAKRVSKYNNRRTEVKSVQGFTYMADSALEARQAEQYDLGVTTGLIKWWQPQASFRLPGNRRYRADFLVVWSDARVSVVDTKGADTDMSRLKRAQVLELYRIDVEIVRKA